MKPGKQEAERRGVAACWVWRRAMDRAQGRGHDDGSEGGVAAPLTETPSGRTIDARGGRPVTLTASVVDQVLLDAEASR